ncbi:MAG: hypothetical protein ABIP58_00500 [Dehalococcoidia bacterium]
MTKPTYHTIDSRIAEEIRRLHKKHPKLGHEGLLKVLKESDIKVDEAELRMFLDRTRMNPESQGTYSSPSSFSVVPLAVEVADGSGSDSDAGGGRE